MCFNFGKNNELEKASNERYNRQRDFDKMVCDDIHYDDNKPIYYDKNSCKYLNRYDDLDNEE